MKDVATSPAWLALPESLRRRFAPGALVEENGAVDIFRALDTTSKRQVAIKACTNANVECFDALHAEFQRLTSLRHDNIIRVYEYFRDDASAAFSMDWIHGSSALHWLWQEDLPPDEQGAHQDDTVEFDETLLYTPPRTFDAPIDLLVPATAPLRTERFEHVARQLFDTLAYLRTQKIVHGDIKHANLKIEVGGRLILLDFGIAFTPGGDTTAGSLTPTYAAPEVLQGQRPTYASDVYSAAVVLFELATRRRFDRSARNSFHHRLRELRRAGVDRGMCRAIALALESKPAARPIAPEAQRWFARRRLRRLALVQRPPAPPTQRAAMAHQISFSLRDHRRYVIALRGEPGGGTTSLATFVATEWAHTPHSFSVWVTCRRSERRAFQALLAVVEAVLDALESSALRYDERDDAWSLRDLPSDTMRSVFASARSSSGDAQRRDPSQHHVLDQALDELALILEQLSTRREILLVIDDIQWMDPDSLAALERLFSRHPLSRLALFFCGRSADAFEETVARLCRAADRSPRIMELDALSEEDALELLRRAFPDTTSTEELQHLYATVGGNPLILTWSARWLSDHGTAPSAIPSLARIVQARLDDLAPDDRAVVYALACADMALPTNVLEHVIRSDIQGTMRRLEASGLVEAPDLQLPDLYMIQHARLAHAIRDALTEDQQHAVLRALVPHVATEMHGTPELVARMLLRLGRADEARPWLVRAARQARRSLALSRAIALYNDVLTLVEGPDALHFHLELAATLEETGAMEQAAHHYLQAARYDRSGPAIDARLHASELLFACGRDSDANAVIQECFRTLACRPYRSTAASLQHALVQRRAFSRWMTRQTPSELVARASSRDEWHARRIEAHRIGANVFGQRDIAEGMFHHAESLRLLQQGASIEHLRSVLTAELGFAALPGPIFASYVDRLQRLLEHLHDSSLPVSGIEELRFKVMMGTAEMSMGRLASAQAEFEQASAAYYDDYLRAPWLGLTASYLYASMCARQFELQRATQIATLARRSFQVDDDAYFATLFALRLDYFDALMADNPSESRRLLARYHLPSDPDAPRLTGYWWYTAMLDTAIYEGQAADALRAIESEALGLVASSLVFSHYIGIEFLFALGRALLDALQSPHSRLEGARWRAILRTAMRLIDRWSTPQSTLYIAALRFTESLQNLDLKEALSAYARLQRNPDCREDRGLKLASRHALWLHGIGVGMSAEEDAFLRAQGVKAPRRMLRMWIPSQRFVP